MKRSTANSTTASTATTIEAASSVATLDVEALRAQFPALQQRVNGHPLVYLDNAATTQKPQAVLDALRGYYERDNANVHRGIHELSHRATEAYESARARTAAWIGAAEPAELIWTRGTTEAINLIALGWGLENLYEGDEVVLSVLEHHSNLVPWQLLSARAGVRLRFIEIDAQGEWMLDDLDALVSEKTRVVALNHVSNALGTVNPVADVIAQVRTLAPEALVLLDGAQAVPHLPVDVSALGCDAYAFSGHKMCGPTGIGALWARRSLLDEMEPWQGGGEMISVVEREQSTWAAPPHKFEPGTPNIAGAVGMGAAVDWLGGLDRDAVVRHEQALVEYAIERLSELPGIHIFGPTDHARRSGVVSFLLGDAHPHDIATILDSEGIAVRAGHHCAQLVMKRYGVSATARASFYLYNTHDDVDRLVAGLHTVHGIFA
jgi:cysteine desulfurase/selenocysteine lyase